MTAIYYPDSRATSPCGRFTVEARSPHNGQIQHADGREPDPDAYAFRYGSHQREFRYRLIQNARSGHLARLFGACEERVLWERWQSENEDSPGGLLVSSDGWAVVRTHGFLPEVIVIAPEGLDRVRVRIVGASDDTEPATSGTRWELRHLACTTAGSYWAGHSWPSFFTHGGPLYFAWRAHWGQCVTIDLLNGQTFLDDAGLASGVVAARIAEEIRGVRALLGSLDRQREVVRSLLASSSRRQEKHPLREPLRNVNGAVNLVGVHRLADCEPYLRFWEEQRTIAFSTRSAGLGESSSLERFYHRPIVQQALRLLDAVPAPHPAYCFKRSNGHRFPMALREPDLPARWQALDRAARGAEILLHLGPPDHVQARSQFDPALGHAIWTEDWEYDHRTADGWITYTLTWTQSGDAPGQITDVREGPSPWLTSEERMIELLRL